MSTLDAITRPVEGERRVEDITGFGGADSQPLGELDERPGHGEPARRALVVGAGERRRVDAAQVHPAYFGDDGAVGVEQDEVGDDLGRGARPQVGGDRDVGADTAVNRHRLVADGHEQGVGVAGESDGNGGGDVDERRVGVPPARLGAERWGQRQCGEGSAGRPEGGGDTVPAGAEGEVASRPGERVVRRAPCRQGGSLDRRYRRYPGERFAVAHPPGARCGGLERDEAAAGAVRGGDAARAR